jgi:hypothetical protein
MEHYRSIGPLYEMGLYRPEAITQSPWDALVASWFRMIEMDVLNHLDEGHRELIRVRNTWKKLIKQRQTPGDGLAPAQKNYRLARWADAAGRLQYRIANWGSAVEFFQQAADLSGWKMIDPKLDDKVCKQEEVCILPCGWDIISNLIRTLHEQSRAPGESKSVEAKIERLCASAKSIFISTFGDPLLITTDATTIPVECGLGYGSLVRNHFEMATDTQKAVLCDEGFRLLKLFPDPYKKGQHQLSTIPLWVDGENGILIGGRSIGIDHVLQWLTNILELPSERFRIRALQQYASILSKSSPSKPVPASWTASGVVPEWVTMCLKDSDQIHVLRKSLQYLDFQAQAMGSGFYNTDVYIWTAILFSKALSPDSQEESNSYILRALRSYRSVQSALGYKRLFAEKIAPQMSRLIQVAEKKPEHLKEDIEDIISLVEEVSCRELLDLLASRTFAPGVSDKEPLKVVSSQSITLRPTFGTQGTILKTETDLDTAEINRKVESLDIEQRGVVIPASPHDDQIALRAKAYAAQKDSPTILRFYFVSGGNKYEGLRAAVITKTGICIHEYKVDQVEELYKMYTEFMICQRKAGHAGNQVKLVDLSPSPAFAKLMYTTLIQPVLKLDDIQNTGLIIIPSDWIFALPLQAAICDSTDPTDLGSRPTRLGFYVPLAFSTSLTSLITRNRHLLIQCKAEEQDDLVSVVCDAVDPYIPWHNVTHPSIKHSIISSQSVMHGIGYGHVTMYDWHEGNMESLVSTLSHPEKGLRPEFFVWYGHGCLIGESVALQIKAATANGAATTSSWLVPEEIALSGMLPRNKLTVLMTCLNGQNASAAGGELSGFLRAFIATGAGALLVTLFPVSSSSTSGIITQLLNTIFENEGCNLMAALQSAQDNEQSNAANDLAVPFALYL